MKRRLDIPLIVILTVTALLIGVILVLSGFDNRTPEQIAADAASYGRRAERAAILRAHRHTRERCTDLRNTPVGSLTTNNQEELRACPSNDELAAIALADQALAHEEN